MTALLSPAAQRVDAYFREHHNVTLAATTITDTPGYWQRDRPCGGRGACCFAPETHWGMGAAGPVNHRLAYFDADARDAGGRWLSPTRTWRELHDAAGMGA